MVAAGAGLARWPAPVVGVDVALDGAWTIRADNRGGLRRAVARLGALGHRRIAYVGGHPRTLAAAREAGLDVPGDVSIVGFDDSPLAAVSPVALTTVRQDPRRMGEMAARAVLAGGGRGGWATVPVELVERASVAVRAT